VEEILKVNMVSTYEAAKIASKLKMVSTYKEARDKKINKK